MLNFDKQTMNNCEFDRYLDYEQPDNGRVDRALSERIFLVRKVEAVDVVQLFVTSSRGHKQYRIDITDKDATCTCPDCTIRNVLCKHLILVLVRVFKQPLHELWKVDMAWLKAAAHRLVKKQELVPKPRRQDDTDCCICYEALDLSSGTPDDFEHLVVCMTCGHAFHNQCMDQWLNTGKNRTCPLCRARMGHNRDAEQTAPQWEC